MIYWLSFADPRLPKGQQFLGACWIRGVDFKHAVQISHMLGINPGGEVQGAEYGDGTGFDQVHESWFNILMTREEITVFDKSDVWRNPRPHGIKGEVDPEFAK